MSIALEGGAVLSRGRQIGLFKRTEHFFDFFFG
jgi:hypothetical protein